MKYNLRKAEYTDKHQIWAILQQAIVRRKNEGSEQWQDGYPNPDVIKNDLEKNAGFVLTDNETIVGYCSILINDEPEYLKIKGKWLTNKNFVVVHRIAVAENHLRKGLAKKIFEFAESYAVGNNIYSIKVDTNFDNFAMLKIFDQLGFVFCGKVYFRGSERLAFEKVLKVQ